MSDTKPPYQLNTAIKPSKGPSTPLSAITAKLAPAARARVVHGLAARVGPYIKQRPPRGRRHDDTLAPLLNMWYQSNTRP
jgi:hypothetical protein